MIAIFKTRIQTIPRFVQTRGIHWISFFDFFALIHSCISGYTISVSFEFEYSTSNIWCCSDCRDGSSAAATSEMERLVIKANGLQLLTIITKRSILVVAAALDPTLDCLKI